MDFIRKYFGIGWFFVAVVFGLFLCISDIQLGLIFIGLSLLCFGAINIARPDVIITNGGIMSLLGAKIFWNFGGKLLAIIILLIYIPKILNEPNLKNLSKKVDISCSEQQLQKTGTKACEDAKKQLATFIKQELPKIKNNYNTLKHEIDTLSKDKNIKCTEKGLVAYGSVGCETVTNELEEKTKAAEELNAQIKNLETKIKK